MNYAAFMLVTVTPAWLALSRQERENFEEEVLGPTLERHAGKVSVRWFDAEAFSGHCSDVVLFEAEDPHAYYALVEDLRETELFTKPYMEVNEVIFGVEEGFRQLDSSGER